MARQKQATPLRREVSSEYTSKADRSATPSKRSRNLDRESEVAVMPLKMNEHANGKIAVSAPAAAQKKQAGLLELVIGVSGIYASLYGPSNPHLLTSSSFECDINTFILV